MTQSSWQTEQTTTQGGQSGQGGPSQAGKVTVTSAFPLEEASGVPAETSTGEGSGKTSRSRPASQGDATADPYLDMSSLGLAPPAAAPGPMQGPAAAPGAHPIPTDEFLKVLEPARLMLLASDVTRPPEASPWALQAPAGAGPEGGATAAAASQLQPTNEILQPGTIVRVAIPADAGQKVPAHRYITNAAELFGWVPEQSVTPTTQQAEPVAGAEELDEEVPVDAMPQLAARDYDHLFTLTEDAFVYVSPGASMNVLTTASRMETVVTIGDPRQIEGKQWQQVRLVREPPVIGWLRAAQGYEVSADPADSQAADQAEQDARASGPFSGADLPLSLDRGSIGPAVLELEQQLAALGFDPGSVDETFDDATHQAVIAFQKSTWTLPDPKDRLDDDGSVGNLTLAALARAARQPAAEEGGASADATTTALATGTWVGGFTVGHVVPTATTPTGAASSAGYSLGPSGTNSTVTGACEVLHVNGSPATSQSGTYVDWYIRGVDGGAGWVHSYEVKPAQGSGEATQTDLSDELAALCPNGITVAFVTQFNEREIRQFDTFSRSGTSFAAQHRAVALSAGQLVTGSVNFITHKDQVIGILAAIQQGLRGGAAELPGWARIAHLAFFTHGSWTRDTRSTEYGGLQLDGNDWAENGNLRKSDLEGFAHTLTAFCTSDVEVSLFACSTGVEDQTGTAETEDSIGSKGERQQAELKGGESGFADLLSDELVAAGATDAMTMGHTTVAHTTQNSNARLFSGEADGGVNVYNWVFLPVEEWMATELADITASRYAQEGKELEFLQYTVFQWYRGEILRDEALATRMSTDPEILKVELRERAIAWIHTQYPLWGVRDAAEVEAGVAYFVPKAQFEQPEYHWKDVGKVSVRVDIPYGTQLETTMVAEDINGRACYPITWEGDPYGPETATPVQAYAPKGWVSVIKP